MASRHSNNRAIYVVFLLLLALALAAVVAIAVFGEFHPDRVATGERSFDRTFSTENAIGQQGEVISHDGAQYRYNNSIKSYLFMGIDSDEKVSVREGAGSKGGRADALFLLVTNTRTERAFLLSIHRNTMTRVEVFSDKDEDLGAYELQICLQHTYGDGGETSCLRTVDAVSYLLYDLPIEGYISLNMGAIPAVNDAIGGVTLTCLSDVENKKNGVSLKKDEQRTLTGVEAYDYIRDREDEFDSATDRLRRQEQYLSAFLVQLRKAAEDDLNVIADLSSAMDGYMRFATDDRGAAFVFV